MNNEKKRTTEYDQSPGTERTMPARPSKFQLTLLDKTSHVGTDIASFKFARKTDADSRQELQKEGQDSYYLNYNAGQYAIVDLGIKEDPEGQVRSFTLASSPTEENFILISTRIRDTPFKRKLASLEVGSLVKITAPLGRFVLHEDYSRPAVFISGGIGVTPFRSMMKYATDKQLPVKIFLFDSNRNEDNILYKKEFDAWATTNQNLRIVYTITNGADRLSPPSSPSSSTNTNNDWKGETGFINKAMLTRHLSITELDNSIFYICGPPGMLNAMKALLQNDLHIPKDRIRVEEFVGY